MAKIVVAVTGASGFFGEALVRNLSLESEYELVTFSGNLLLQKDIEGFFNKYPHIDVCVHLAGTFAGDFPALVESNLLTMAAVTKFFPMHGCQKFIFSSSGAVYGDETSPPFSEDTPLRPSTPYGLVKKWCEEYLLIQAKMQHFISLILRFPSIYGPKNTKGVISNFVHDIHKKKQVTIYGDGTQTRDFLHIDDACKAVIQALSYPESETFNISNENPYTLNQVIKLLKQNYSFTIQHQPIELKQRHLALSSHKAREKLHFDAKHKQLALER